MHGIILICIIVINIHVIILSYNGEAELAVMYAILSAIWLIVQQLVIRNNK